MVVLCELNADVIMRSDIAPAFGQVEQRVESGSVTLGSSGAITATALAALGLEVAVCGTLGDDHLGSLLLTMLTDLGVDVRYVRRLPARQTGITVVLARPDGDRALLTYPGTMVDFSVGDIPAEIVDSTRHLHVSSIFLQSGLSGGLADLLAGRPAGVTASLDPGWDPDRTWSAVKPILAQLDWLLPNANECLGIAGSAAAPTDDTAIAAAAADIAAAGPSVAVKLGAAGALSVHPGGARPVRLRGVERLPVDTTGAGDNFNAGFLAALLGSPVSDDADLLALGCACGTISIGGLGGTGRLAGRAEAELLAAEILTGNRISIEEAMRPIRRPAPPDGEPKPARPDLEYR